MLDNAILVQTIKRDKNRLQESAVSTSRTGHSQISTGIASPSTAKGMQNSLLLFHIRVIFTLIWNFLNKKFFRHSGDCFAL